MTFLNPKVWFIVGMIALAGYLVWYGDNHGFSARKLDTIQRDLDKANARIKGFTQADDQAAIDADVLRDEGYQRALKDLGANDKCIVTPGMIQAFERLLR